MTPSNECVCRNGRVRRSAWVAGLLLWIGAQPSAAQVCDSTAFRPISELAGEWLVNAEDRGPDLTFERTTGRAVLTRALRGCSLLMSYTGSRQDAAFEALSVIVMKSDGGIEVVGADSVHDGLRISLGHFDGETLTVGWERDLGGRVLSTRLRISISSADAFSVLRELRRADDQPWEVTYRAEYSRTEATPH